MAGHDAAAFGIYRDRLSTATAIEALRAAGFRNNDIVTLFPDEIGTWQLPPTKPGKLIEGILLGAVAGLAVAASATWFLPLSFISNTPALTLAILSAGAAVGSLAGAFVCMRMEAYDQRYESRVRRGDILVSVHCDDPQWTEKAKELLRRAGGEDVSSSDRITIDFARTNRILVRPAYERTSVPPLRLVQRESTGGTGRSLTSQRSRKHRSRRHWS